ncbi:Mu transposase C-terminal domain-containing protein [Bacillus sp. DJP31]|uniref:Mu transposase C-terminal domain-containing protein n=1 Tax=Bacillus sp. DJP31 TaxID=3409789 RepID=UPI003BB5A290
MKRNEVTASSDLTKRRGQHVSLLNNEHRALSCVGNIELLFMENRSTTITKNGIHNLGLTYLSVDLLKLSLKLEKWGHGSMVLFKFDPTDLSKIHVYDEYEKRFLTIPCTDLEYTKTLTLKSHTAFLKDLNKKKIEKVFKDANEKLSFRLPGKKYELNKKKF